MKTKMTLKEMACEMTNLLQQIMSSCQRKDNNHASRFDVSPSECRTMRVFQPGESLTMKELSQRMDLAMSRMTRIVDGLVEKKLVERATDPNDRRVCLVHLTSLGNELVTEMETTYLAMNQKVLESVAPEARIEVLKALHKLADAMQKIRFEC